MTDKLIGPKPIPEGIVQAMEKLAKESRQAAVRANPEHMAIVRRAYADHHYMVPPIAGDLDDNDYDMVLAVEAFALGFIAGVSAKETEQ